MARRSPEKRKGRKAAASRKGKKWFFKKKTFWNDVAGMTVSGVKSLLGLNTETKFVDTNTATNTTALTTTLANTGISNVRTAIPQGDTSSNRNGNGVRMVSWKFFGDIYNFSGNLVPSIVRIIIVNWHKVAYADSSAAYILQSQTDIHSLRNTDPQARFTILSDKKYFLKPSSTGQNTQIQPWNFVYRPQSHHMRWTDADTAGANTNMLEGYISVYAFTDNFTASNPPTIQCYSRVEYVDN